MKLSTALKGYILYAQNLYAGATAEHYSETLKMVIRHLGDRELETVTTKDIQVYFHFLKTEYKPHRFGAANDQQILLSPAGVKGYWKALRSFFKWADETIPQPKYQLAQVQAISRDELKRIFYSAEWTKQINVKNKKPYRMRRPSFRRDVVL